MFSVMRFGFTKLNLLNLDYVKTHCKQLSIIFSLKSSNFENCQLN